ncbi:GA-binding protein subunit beta-2-like isoform X2 [Watersipora subatra]|uniref:GA-binding protein subunit beta-2-like isoform X2 n=1 Tax=Watersipora subatra TaxID=2589382 RepID=UPI00355B66B8
MAEQVVVSPNITGGTILPNRTTVPMSLVDLGKRLLDASKRGDTMEIRTLMSSGAPFTTDWLGTSPLHFAALHGHIETVTILLRAGISRDARTKVDKTPLHVAAEGGHFEVVQILLKNCAIVDAVDMLKMTPLHWAVEKGHTNVVNLLLKHDASTHHLDKFDRSPMDIALGSMQMDIVQLLQTATTNTRSLATQDTMMEEEVLTTENPEQILSTNQHKAGKILLSSEKEQGQTELFVQTDVQKTSQESEPSVLSAFATLAEARASTAGTSGETANWLSSRGIQMASSDTDTPFALTEAGKLALTNFIKDQGVTGDNNTVMTLVDEDGNQVLLVQQPGDPGGAGDATVSDMEGETSVSTMAEEITSVTEETTTEDLQIDTRRVGEAKLLEESVE